MSTPTPSEPTAEPAATVPPELLHPARVQGLLALLFAVEVELERAARVAAELPTVQRASARAGWQVGGQRVRYYGPPDEPLRVAWFGCSCPAWPGPPCDHMLTVLLLLAWHAEGGSRWFYAPLWELALGRALVEPPVAPAPPAAAPHEGWIRYHLAPEGVGEGGWEVDRELIRVGRRGQAELKPQSCPEQWAQVCARVRGLSEADHAFHTAWEGWVELRKLYGARWATASERGRRLLTELEDRMIRALVHARDVQVAGRPVRVVDRPLLPVLVGDPGPDGGLTLAWDPPELRRLALGSGWVVDLQGQLRPLAPGLEPPLLALLGKPLPPVSAAEVDGFLRRGMQSGRLPLRLSQPEAVGALEPERREARLALSEDGEVLLVDLLFAYGLDGAEHMAPADPPLPLVPLPAAEGGPRWLTRDRAWELEEKQALEQALERTLPARVSGEDALILLSERLPELAGRWPIFGQERLTRQRVRGVLEPRARLGPGTDWLDIQVGFHLEGQVLTPAPVLEAWAMGRPWLRLPDGALARLPEAWLRRHARALAELEELRRAGVAPLAALPVAAELLPEAEGDTSPWRAALDALEGRAAVPEAAPPPGLRAELRPYQRQGFAWLRWLGGLGLGAVLADDMGLGKTVQTLALLLDRGGPSLVVCPSSALFGWAEEARRFAPGLRVRLYHGPGRASAALPGADLVLTTFALLRQDQARLAGIRWRTVVLDEAQNIRNPSSALSQAARTLRAEQRVALTGTPFENHLHELRSLFEFVLPGFFGSRQAFASRYAVPVERRSDAEALQLLRRRIRPFILRRLKRDVAPELPPLQQVVLRVELLPEQRALYEGLRERLRASVQRQVAEVGLERAALHILEALTRLRQACCHPALLPMEEARAVSGSAKLDALEEALEAAIAGGHRSLVFSQWPSFLERVAERLGARGWEHLLLRGSTRDRQGLVERWNHPEGPPVFLISLKAGGTALNLTAADHVFHLDPWWNPAAEAQATDRAHRLGQTRPVTAWRLVARDTVEERILALHERKRAVFEAALAADPAQGDALPVNELREVLEALDAEAAAAPGADPAPAEAPADPEQLDSRPPVQ